MRNGVTCAVVLMAAAFFGGCASKEAVVAKGPSVPASPHISVAMDEETQRALLGEEVPRDLLADSPVGTTTLTGADLYIAPKASTPPALPEERGSTSVFRTWGAPDTSDAPPAEVDGIPTSRE